MLIAPAPTSLMKASPAASRTSLALRTPVRRKPVAPDAVKAPTLAAPRIRFPLSAIDVAPPVSVTAWPKSLSAVVRVIAPAPALSPVVPVTLRPFVVDWLIAPPLLVATSAPVTVPRPRFKAPLLFTVNAPVASVPSVRAPLSVICVVPPVSESAWPK